MVKARRMAGSQFPLRRGEESMFGPGMAMPGNRFHTANRRRKAGDGFAMIELMIALTVLTVGLMGLLSLILASINSNGRNKLDSAGTLVAQGVIEQIAAQNTLSTAPSVTDCAGNTSTINTTG